MLVTRTPWQIQKAVVFSLFLREMKTRFGAQKFGYFWAIAEPAAIIVVFWVMFGFTLRRTLPGVDYPMFLMTGMLPFQLFSNIVTRSMNAIEANQGLFNYRQVKPIDTLIARTIVESLVYLIAFILFILAGHGLGFDASIGDLIGLIFILFFLLIFSFSCGLLCAVIGSFAETFQKVVGIMMRPLFFCSGIFFAVAVVPEKYRWLFLLNPVLHFLELIRTYYFASFHSQHASHLYVLSWTVGMSALSLWLYVRLKYRILTT
jgi:capsular polysaccharide transport system permease protein